MGDLMSWLKTPWKTPKNQAQNQNGSGFSDSEATVVRYRPCRSGELSSIEQVELEDEALDVLRNRVYGAPSARLPVELESIFPPGFWRVRFRDFKTHQFLVGSGNVLDDVELTQLFHYYGSHPTDFSLEKLKADCAIRRIPLICGSASLLVKELLRQLGIQARVVTSLRSRNFNTYDNGHTLLEVLSPDLGWILFDPGYGGWIVSGSDYVSALQLNEIIGASKQFQFVPVAYRHFGEFKTLEGKDLSFSLEEKWHSPARTVSWYQEVFRYFGVEDPQRPTHYEFLADSEAVGNTVSSYSPAYHGLERTKFLSKYYGGSFSTIEAPS